MSKTLYVGNLSLRTTQEEIRQLFELYGEVTSVDLVSMIDTLVNTGGLASLRWPIKRPERRLRPSTGRRWMAELSELRRPDHANSAMAVGEVGKVIGRSILPKSFASRYIESESSSQDVS